MKSLTNRRAGCGKPASPVRREGQRKPMCCPYPYRNNGLESPFYARYITGWKVCQTATEFCSKFRFDGVRELDMLLIPPKQKKPVGALQKRQRAVLQHCGTSD
jgi:hypothetical protein